MKLLPSVWWVGLYSWLVKKKTLSFRIGPPTWPPKRLLSRPGLMKFGPVCVRAFEASMAFRLRFWKYSYRRPCHWLVPETSVWLNCPPDECPNSGENWFCSTVKFCTASLGMVMTGPVTDLLLLSTPSTVKLLLRGRCPATEGPVPAPMPPLVATPASSSERLRTPSPTVAVGRSCSSLLSKVF